ncbi:DUF2237 domain-containing protein [uncultured Jannaschia sp.]|uniref:DUF2237 family protein n=1 Tax=uncultured Jannaschia sp. TaxID=293347 RepID=UPI0026314450|nr:DUF2237 domain-containing protein [uncultured Jannaschia sp.]
MAETGKQPSVNVFDERLETCSTDPMTGFFRDGCCNTSGMDGGVHTVCAVVTEDFLEHSRESGNDLSTPRPEYGFAGLKPGDRWCLCASRFLDAHEHGAAPRIRLAATHKRTLDVVPMDVLTLYAMDIS